MSNMEKSDLQLLIASSVHDMKNTLAMILDSADNAATDDADAREKALATLRYEASRLSNDLIHLMGVYRVNVNELPIAIDECEVMDLLMQQKLRNEVLLNKHGIRLEIDCDEYDEWYFDQELIGGVINNVIVNAVRYTKSQIKMSAKVENDWLCIKIEDDGPGFPPAMIENPAHDMKQIDFRQGSTSMGIYFASRVCAMHTREEEKGYIMLQNGGAFGGSVFNIFLP